MKKQISSFTQLSLMTVAAMTLFGSLAMAQYNRGGDRNDNRGVDRGQDRGRISNSCRVVTSGLTNVAQAQCDRTEYAINGGGKCIAARGKQAALVESIPLHDRTGLSVGWQADCHFMDNSAGAQAQAYVTCCPL